MVLWPWKQPCPTICASRTVVIVLAWQSDLPPSLFEFETENTTAIQGATEKDLTVFESALCLRQVSLTAVQQAISKDRLVRASRSRPQKVKTEDVIRGATQIEIHRDDAWRGPATLLEIDEDNGTAIATHQRKPYLLPIRMVRKYVGTFFNMDVDSGETLNHMMKNS